MQRAARRAAAHLREAARQHACFTARSFAAAAEGPFTAVAPLRVCVVGSGPAGFYTADRLLHRFGDAVQVDILERLPAPFGLVRYGVAPDHPDTKSVASKFARLAADARVGLLCAVEAGRHVALPALRARYHAVVLATGAPADRPLSVPGAALRNSLPARSFVEWYNGHPDAAAADIDLTAGDTAVVLGLGNVALDCARVLLRAPDALARTDIAAHALAALRASRIRRVVLVGRRGPAQAACTPKELRELLSLPAVRVTAPPGQLQLSAADAAEVAENRVRRRAVEEMQKAVARDDALSAADAAARDRELRLLFLRSPAAVLPSAADGSRVGGVRLEVTRLARDEATGAQKAIGTGVFEELPAALVLSSIGYRGAPLPGAPFDAAAGTVPHTGGAVRAAGAGLYAVGWAKRGPSGIIGTNLTCAEDTVATLAADALAGALPEPALPGGVAVLAALAAAAGATPVPHDAWLRIDAAERAAGAALGKPREKAVTVEALLALARAEAA